MRQRWAEEAEQNAPAPAATSSGGEESRQDAPLVGQTGARFGPRSMRLRWRRENAEQSSTGLASSSPIARPDDTDARAESIAVTADAGQAARGDADETGWDEPEYLTVLVRPYVWTGGRVLSNDDLPLETLISTNQRRGTRDVEANPPEWRVIVEMCAGPRSVAEVAAALHMPLGIARVVIKDMADDGTIIVHRTAGAAGNGPDRELLLRIRDGLRRL